jgi:hypothetical protein
MGLSMWVRYILVSRRYVAPDLLSGYAPSNEVAQRKNPHILEDTQVIQWMCQNWGSDDNHISHQPHANGLFGCLLWVVFDIREHWGPNTSILRVWRVSVLKLGIQSQYLGRGPNGKKRGEKMSRGWARDRCVFAQSCRFGLSRTPSNRELAGEISDSKT